MNMCMNYIEVQVGWRKMQVKCGSRDHWGAAVWCCGCAVWPEAGGSDCGSEICEGSKCCSGMNRKAVQ